MSSIEGWLDKKSIFGIWTSRYLKLSVYRLSIYKDSSRSTPESEFELDSQTIIETNDSNECQFKVKVQNTKTVSLTLRAPTPNQMIDWVFHLRSASYANRAVYITMFNTISLIAKGLYGKIILCSKKNSNDLVAIKSIKKEKLYNSKTNKVSSILNEKMILASIHNPFIINLKYAFQNSKYYYLAVEYAPGGNLFQRLKSGKISISDLKLYIAELTIAIQELHKNNIIYRDMKPENVMIAEDGHIKLIDFGLSTFCGSNQSKITFCGTAEYIAPEVILGQGYKNKIDWWGLGVLMYELLYKSTPFFGMNVQYIYQSILTKEPVFPKNEDPAIVSFIQSLLQKDPSKRGGYKFIVDSEFMSDIDFDLVYKKEISPSFVPVIKDVARLDQISGKIKSFNSDSDSDIQQFVPTNNTRTDDFSFNYIHDNISNKDKL